MDYRITLTYCILWSRSKKMHSTRHIFGYFESSGTVKVKLYESDIIQPDDKKALPSG